jgi:hypothetical protein
VAGRVGEGDGSLQQQAEFIFGLAHLRAPDGGGPEPGAEGSGRVRVPEGIALVSR